MSSRSSRSEICRRSWSSAASSSSPRRPASMRTDASVTSRAKRSGRIAVSPWPRRLVASVSASASGSSRGSAGPASSRPPSAWRAASVATRSATSSSSSGGPRTCACSPRRSTHDATMRALAYGVAKTTEPSSPGRISPNRPKWRETCHAMRSETRTSAIALRLAELPRGAAGVVARVELLARRAAEVVLGLRRVRDLAAHPRQAEDAQRVAVVGAAQEVELPALEEQVVRVDLAGPRLVALHRVVVEEDRLAAEDRGLDLREALRQLLAAGRGGDAQRDRLLLGLAERARAAPRQLLQRQAQRLGVGELPVEQRQRGAERGELAVGERDRGEVELLRAQRVVLLLGDGVGRPVHRELDAERFELGAVGVEPARERILVHAAVALDVAADLQRGDGAALGHQVRDERQLPDELLGVLRHESRQR